MTPDTQFTVGKILKDTAVRDAVHFALAPVIVGEALHPGARVKLVNGVAYETKIDSIGIIDPFLPASVSAGQRVWLFLNPNTVTSLKHAWTHPAFEEEKEKDPRITHSREWLHHFAGKLDITYDELIGAALNWMLNGEVFICHGFDTPDYNAQVFWKHYGIATGGEVPPEVSDDGYFISCSC